MTGRIHPDDVQRVREGADIVALVAEVTQVRRSGRAFTALCPFHQEKTPSFSIDPQKNVFYCFGCQRKGDAIRFVQDSQNLTFPEALTWLARRLGIELREIEGVHSRGAGERAALGAAMEAAVGFYHERLLSGRDAGLARAYLRGRGYGGDVARRFRLGYAPDGGEALVRHLRAGGVTERVLVEASLASRSGDGRVFDRFRGRLVFPIFDPTGAPIAIGARALQPDAQPKYLNSASTPLYQKERTLYGLNWARQAIGREGVAVLVEGYTDVISLHLAGVETAVASCGTALTEEQLRTLGRYAGRVVLAFDGDAAGGLATERTYAMLDRLELDFRAAALPRGLDPADAVAEIGADGVRAAVAGAQPLLEFALDRTLARFNMDEPESRARALRAAIPVVAAHPAREVREQYAGHLARLARTGVDVVAAVEHARANRGAAAHTRQASEAPAARARRPGRPARRSRAEKAERAVLAVALDDPGALATAEPPVTAAEFRHPEWGELFGYILPHLGTKPDVAALADAAPPALADRLLRLAVELAQEQPIDADDAVRELRMLRLDEEISDLQGQLDATNKVREPGKDDELYHRLLGLEGARRALRRSGQAGNPGP